MEVTNKTTDIFEKQMSTSIVHNTKNTLLNHKKASEVKLLSA